MAYTINPLSKIIGLSGMLAVGFLLVVLSTALYGTWFPILDAFIFGIAHLPYLVTSGISSDYQTGFGDVSDNVSSNAADFGKWLSSFLVVSGVALPITLCRSNVLMTGGAFLSVVGGMCIYATIVTFTTFFDGFKNSEDSFFM